MASSLVNCPWCGSQNPTGAIYCGDCARRLQFEAACAACGTQNPGSARYCDACGEPMPGASAAELSTLAQPAHVASSAGATVAAASIAPSLQLPRFMTPTAAALVLILATAAILRLVSLTDVPPNVTADEADNLQVVYHILADQGPGFFGLDWKPAPAFSTYVMAAFMRVFGETIVGMRMASVVLSLLSLAVFYLVARESLSRLASLSSTFLLGTGLWYLHFSRSGWENLHVGLYALLATLALTWAVKRGSWYLYAAAGVFAALGLYGYSTGRLIVVAVLLYLPVALLHNRENRRHTLLGFALAVVVAAALFAPQLKTALDDWDRFNYRTRAVSIFNTLDDYRGESGATSIILHQVWRTIDGFLLMDSGMSGIGINARYIPPSWAVLDRITGLLFWLGLIVSVRRFRQTALWWAMMLALLFPIQVLSTWTPDAARAVGAAPFFYLFVGLGLDFLFNLPIKRKLAVRAAAVPLLAAIAYINVSAYFQWMDEPHVRAARQPAVEVEEFDRWQALQMEEARAGRWGFNVNQWHEMRERLQP